MADMEVRTFHGWAFDSNCWNKMQSISRDDINWANYDRGYFGSPRNVHFEKADNQKIIITHSFGLHLCAKSLLKQADILIILAGFPEFHPDAATARKRSKRVLKRMIANFQRQPRDVLTNFYRNVYHPSTQYSLPPKDFNKQLLYDDLKRLNEGEISIPTLKKSAKVCIFHGTEDIIVSPQKGKELKENFDCDVRLEKLPGAGHALPMNHAERCWSTVVENYLAEQNMK